MGLDLLFVRGEKVHPVGLSFLACFFLASCVCPALYNRSNREADVEGEEREEASTSALLFVLVDFFFFIFVFDGTTKFFGLETGAEGGGSVSGGPPNAANLDSRLLRSICWKEEVDKLLILC